VSQPAIEKKIDSASVEGLEEVFCTSEENTSTSEASEEPHIIGGSASELLNTEDAAKKLGISSRAVINRLKAGTLPGKQVQGKYRKEWRVFWNEVPKSSEEQPEIRIEGSEASEEPAKRHSEEFRSSSERSEDTSESTAILGLLEQNKRLMDQLNALTYRNGYLESKLEEREKEVQLLTDSQHKRGWWSRFGSWFMTGR
jgi:hypothetical protein